MAALQQACTSLDQLPQVRLLPKYVSTSDAYAREMFTFMPYVRLASAEKIS